MRSTAFGSRAAAGREPRERSHPKYGVSSRGPADVRTNGSAIEPRRRRAPARASPPRSATVPPSARSAGADHYRIVAARSARNFERSGAQSGGERGTRALASPRNTRPLRERRDPIKSAHEFVLGDNDIHPADVHAFALPFEQCRSTFLTAATISSISRRVPRKTFWGMKTTSRAA